MKRIGYIMMMLALFMASGAFAETYILSQIDTVGNYRMMIVRVAVTNIDSALISAVLQIRPADLTADWWTVAVDSTLDSAQSIDTLRAPAPPTDLRANTDYLYRVITRDSLGYDTSAATGPWSTDNAPNVSAEYRSGPTGSVDINTWHFTGFITKPGAANSWSSPKINITEYKSVSFFYRIGGIDNNCAFDSVKCKVFTNKWGIPAGISLDSVAIFKDTLTGVITIFPQLDSTYIKAKSYGPLAWFNTAITDSSLAARDTAVIDSHHVDLVIEGRK